MGRPLRKFGDEGDSYLGDARASERSLAHSTARSIRPGIALEVRNAAGRTEPGTKRLKFYCASRNLRASKLGAAHRGHPHRRADRRHHQRDQAVAASRAHGLPIGVARDADQPSRPARRRHLGAPAPGSATPVFCAAAGRAEQRAPARLPRASRAHAPALARSNCPADSPQGAAHQRARQQLLTNHQGGKFTLWPYMTSEGRFARIGDSHDCAKARATTAVCQPH